MMPSANRIPVPEPLYRIDDLKLLLRDILFYARSLPPGNERNQHRQIARSLRGLFGNKEWLDAYTTDGPKYGHLS
jgi:hypothetical protein